MSCYACERPIEPGERYIAIERSVERQDAAGVVSVEYAEVVVAYHLKCVPPVSAKRLDRIRFRLAWWAVAVLGRRALGLGGERRG
jgi:hypothetical protein